MALKQIFPKLNSPPDWAAKIAELERAVAETGEALTKKRAERRDVAGNLVVFGGDPKPLAALEDQERELEKKLDGLRSGIEIARTELEKVREAERQAKLEALRRQREQIAVKVRERAGEVDRLFSEANAHLEGIDALLRDLRNAGGGGTQPLRTLATRALIAADMRQFFDREVVSGPHCKPLTQQLEGFLSASPVLAVVENLATEAEPRVVNG